MVDSERECYDVLGSNGGFTVWVDGLSDLRNGEVRPSAIASTDSLRHLRG